MPVCFPGGVIDLFSWPFRSCCCEKTGPKYPLHGESSLPANMPTSGRLGLVENLGEYASSCGYCSRQEETSLATGMWAHQLSVEAYQELLDRGWRRSGCWLYKPDSERTCCPPYTVRLDVHKFRMTKVHRKVLRKMDAYLAGGLLHAQQQQQQQLAARALDAAAETALPAVGVRMPDSPSDKRRKMANGSVCVPIAGRSGERPASLQQEVKLEIGAAVQSALQQCILSGRLPSAGYPQVRVQEPTAKQRKSLAKGVFFTSPTPLAVAAMACKAAKGTLYVTGEAVAKMLAVALAARPDTGSNQWSVEAANGHLNFAIHPEHQQHCQQDGSAACSLATAAQFSSDPMTQDLLVDQDSMLSAEQQPPSSGTDRSQEAVLQIWDSCMRTNGQAATESDDSSDSTLQLLAISVPMVCDVSYGSNLEVKAVRQGQALLAERRDTDAAEGTASVSAAPGMSADVLPRACSCPGHAAAAQSETPDTVAFCPAVHAGSSHAGGHVSSVQRHHPYSREGLHDCMSPRSHTSQQGASVPAAAAAPSTRAEVFSQSGFQHTAIGDAADSSPVRLPDGSTSHRASPTARDVQLHLQSSHEQAHEQQCSTPAPREESLAAAAAQQAQPGRPRSLHIIMKRSTPELVVEEFPLYYRYQVLHHHDAADQVTASQFKRFLIDTPLTYVPAFKCPPGQSPPCGFGTFHQQYWIDGRLVAVGVIDVLPNCLSSKYFFWDPEFAPLALGKFSALKEIGWVTQAACCCPSLHYYYMGYYIHSCPKMRYKADYEPSDLLCNQRLCWVPYERCRALLDENEYATISDVALDDLDAAEFSLPAQLLRKASGSNSAASSANVASSSGVSDAALAATLLLICAGPGRDGRLVQFGQLAMLQAWPREVMQQLRRKLISWHRLVGKAAERLVYLM